MFAVFLSALSETHVSYTKNAVSYSDQNYSIEMRLNKLVEHFTAILVKRYHGQLV